MPCRIAQKMDFQAVYEIIIARQEPKVIPVFTELDINPPFAFSSPTIINIVLRK